MKKVLPIIVTLSLSLPFLNAQAMAMKNSDTTFNNDVNTNGTLSVDNSVNTEMKQTTVVGLV